MDDLLQLEAYPPQHTSVLMHEVLTPLNWREWDRILAMHPDQQFRAYIVSGIRRGFRIGFDGRIKLHNASHNMPSAQDHPAVIRDYLAEECSEGRVLGPLDPSAFPQVHVSRFGVIPKGSTGKWRLIVDMSSPAGASVNDGVREDLCSLSYVTIWDAAHCVVGKGAGAL